MAKSAIKLILQTTLESGIHVGQGINVGPGKLDKNNKSRAWKIWQIPLKYTNLW